MSITGPAIRLTIFVGERDIWNRKPLYTEIVRRAHRAGLAGATVLRGIEGYGASARIHVARVLTLVADLPIAIIIVDQEQRIRSFLPQLELLVTTGLAVIEPVEVVRSASRGAPAAGR